MGVTESPSVAETDKDLRREIARTVDSAQELTMEQLDRLFRQIKEKQNRGKTQEKAS